MAHSSSDDDELYGSATECGHCSGCCPPDQCRHLPTGPSKEWLQLQVLEMSPDMTRMGDSYVAASDLLTAHQDVIHKLQSKQSPVEELLKQADQLIATQRPRAEVYAAMAESLGQAWKDLNGFLEQRRAILEYNVSFHNHGEDVIDKLTALDRETAGHQSGQFPPSDVEAVKRLKGRLEETRKAALESFRLALLDGDVLLDKLAVMKSNNGGTLDSRPAHILPAINAAIDQVRRWLEALHDRRRRSESAYQQRRAFLDQWAEVCDLRKDLAAADKRLEALGRNGNNVALGDSSATAELLLFDHNKILPDCKELQERTLKLAHRAEELQSHWKVDLCPAGLLDQVRQESYTLLDKVSEFLDGVEQRSAALEQSVHFFRVAAASLTKLDQLEVQLTAHQAAPGSPQLAQLHAQVSRALEDATAPALHHGYSLLDLIGRSHPGAEGIRRTVEIIENRGIQLGSLCTAHKEQSIKITQAVRSFIDQYELLYSWLIDVVEGYLRNNTDMKGTLPDARQVLDGHNQLLNDLNMKGTEIDALLRSVNHLCEMAEEAQAHEVQMKGDNLHDAWQGLRRALGDRVELMQTYVRLHALANQVQEAWNDVEAKCSAPVEDLPVRAVEESWLNGQQKFLQLSQLGRNFMADVLKVSDRYLDVRKACLCVESLLEYLGGRQLAIHQLQESWTETVTTVQQTRQEWTQFNATIQSALEIVHKGPLYPMLPHSGKSLPKCPAMMDLIERKSDKAVEEMEASIHQLEERKRQAESIQLPSDHQESKSRMVAELNLAIQRMQFRLKEYKTLIQMAEVVFKNLSEVENMVDILDGRERSAIYRSVPEVDQALAEHQVARNTVNELLKITRQEADQLVSLLRNQEPAGVAQPDMDTIEAYLKRAESEWDRSCQAEEVRLAAARQRCHFNEDLHAIHVQLDELSRQLAAMTAGLMAGRAGHQGGLAAVRLTSEAFLQFEKTIQLLEVRIGSFFSTAHQMAGNDPQKTYFEAEMGQIDRKWSTFHKEVDQTRKRIDLSLEYFGLVDEVEQSFRQGGQLLITLARKSAQVRTASDAEALLKEVDQFVKPQEAQTEEKLRKISKLAVELYGPTSSQTQEDDPLRKESRNMMESFAVINTELSTMAANLKAADQERIKQAETQAAVQESLEAARAEAAAARAAAEEARRAAEAAAQALKEEVAPPRPPLPADMAPTPPSRRPMKEIYQMEGPKFVSLLQDATVQESKSVRLSCTVTGKPPPIVSWLKDGVDIANNLDYQTECIEETDGQTVVCSLTIDETFVDDSGRFTCQASNPAGFAQTTATLNVQECSEGGGPLVPPIFVEPLVDTTAREGQPHKICCRVTGVPPPDVSWFKNGSCVDHSRDYLITTLDDGLCQLELAQVFVEDGATFECRARNEAGEAVTSARLNVEPLEPTEAPAFNPGLSNNVMARTGQRVRLECVVSAGLPKPTVHWLHNNKPLKETRDVKTMMEGENRYLLTITEAFPKDAGIYTAVARNVVGEAMTTCSLAVKGRVPTETSDSELASDMEPIKPSIQQALPETRTAQEGQKVQLDCVIVAQPEPEVIWYHNDRPVKESSDFQLAFQGDRCSLIIREAFHEDSGTYRVVAINSAGEASSQCQLTVAPLASKEISSPVLISVQSPGEPPKFSRTFGDVEVLEGGRLVLECAITGRPKPKVQWFHQDRLLEQPGSGQAGPDEYRLVLDHLNSDQAGPYKCVAENEAGVASCQAMVTIRPPEVAPFAVRKAVFSQSSSTTVMTSHQEVSSSSKSVTFQEQVEEEAVQLSVKERANLFGPSSAGLKKPSGHQRKEVGPRFVTPLTGAMVEPGARVLLEAIVDGHPVPDVKWYKNGVELSPEDLPDGLEVSFGGQKARLSLDSAQESDAGRYTCTARNPAGTASSTADVVVRRSQFPPVFGRRLQAQTVRTNSRVTMEVEVTGTPQPEVSWLKDDRPLPPHAAVSADNGRHRVVLAKVTELDAGRYTVRAANKAGEAVSTAELFVSAPTPDPSARKHPPLKVDVAAASMLHPEPPPEVLFAPKAESPVKSAPSSARIGAVAEKARALEEASKVLSPTDIPGAIRLLPLPTPPAESLPAPPPSTSAPPIGADLISKFEPFPELEPFPFVPDPPSNTGSLKKGQPAAIRKPGRFVRGQSRESDYESDLEGAKIRPRWTPAGSDADDSSSTYRKVKVRLSSEERRAAGQKEPTPPSQFEQPPPLMDGPPRPQVLSDEIVSSLIQAKSETIRQETVKTVQHHQTPTKVVVQQPAAAQQPQTPRKPSQKALEMEKQWSHRFVTSHGSKIWPPQAPPEESPSSSVPAAVSAPIWTGQTISVAESVKPSNVAHHPKPAAVVSSAGVETIQRMQMEEETAYSKRFVTVEQTSRRIVQQQQLEPFPFVPDPPRHPPERSPTSTLTLKKPSKFIPAGMSRESDYESDYEGAKIRPRWNPSGSDAEEPKYRVVHPPASGGRSPSITRPVKTPTPPTVFDNPPSFQGPPRPVISPTDPLKIKSSAVETLPAIVKPKAVRPVPTPAGIAQDKAASHFSQMSSAFRTKAQQFAQQVITEVKQPPPPVIVPAVIEPSTGTTMDPQAYHEESRATEFGTKHIDPDTGLIYFKYDFGYEFGLVLPGQPQKVDKVESAIGAEPGSIELPVLHERTGNTPSPVPPSSTGRVPSFQPKKFTTPFKPTPKWEPTDSEMSDGGGGPSKPSQYYDERKPNYSKFRPS